MTFLTYLANAARGSSDDCGEVLWSAKQNSFFHSCAIAAIAYQLSCLRCCVWVCCGGGCGRGSTVDSWKVKIVDDVQCGELEMRLRKSERRSVGCELSVVELTASEGRWGRTWVGGADSGFS